MYDVILSVKRKIIKKLSLNLSMQSISLPIYLYHVSRLAFTEFFDNQNVRKKVVHWILKLGKVLT